MIAPGIGYAGFCGLSTSTNTAFQSSLQETPFGVVYGRDPLTVRSYEPGEARVAAVAQEMEERAAFLDDVRYRLEQAQAV
jgi:hypothetical protein